MWEPLREVRDAVRACRRAPFFTAGVVAVLALGIGANGAVFSILRAVLLQPLPYRSPNRVVMLWQAPNRSDNWRRGTTSTVVTAWHDQSGDVLEDVASLKLAPNNLDAQFDVVLADRAERLRGALVSPNFFDLLGVAAERGRVFTPSDEAAGARDLIVLSHALWQRDFGGDASVVGRTLSLTPGRAAARSFTVVGVLPAAFRFTYPQETEIWLLQPWSEIRASDGRAIEFNGAVARLEPGVTLEQAQARMAAVGMRPVSQDTAPADRQIVRLEPVSTWVMGEVRPSLLLLGGVALLLLLITCATVANAFFVRVTERQRELAVRTALGASRAGLVRLLLAEGAVVCVGGALAGTLLAVSAGPVLRALIPAAVPRGDTIGADTTIVAFGIVASIVAIVFATVLPAWRSSRFDVASTLKRAATTASADRSSALWRQSMLGLEAGIATALLVSAALLLVSFWRLNHVPLGFDGDKVLTVEMRLLDRKFRAPGAVPNFQDAVVARVAAIPGVAEVGLTSAVPFRGVDFMFRFDMPGGRAVNGNGRYVDAAYFSIMRIPVLHGRIFDRTDTANAGKVVVVSASFARNAFGTEDAVGRMLDEPESKQVVGVVGDVRYVAVDRDAGPAVYLPRSQRPSELMCLIVRSSLDAPELGPSVRAAIHDVDPTLPAMDMTTIGTIISESVADKRFFTTSTAAFAGLALLLTLVGLGVIVARAVVERTREMAIRSALGASSRRLVALVVAQGLTPVAIGGALGLVAAFWGSTLLARFLFGIAPRTLSVYVGVGLFVLAVALIACLLPARRVTAVTPASALRAE
jgi:putative ABC transport system permease protein